MNNNGNVTFEGQLATFTPFPLDTTGEVIIAPFFADVDTRGTGSGLVRYGSSTVGGHNAFGVNWIDVGYYSRQVDKLNSFQLVLIEREDVAPGAFDIEFNYLDIQLAPLRPDTTIEAGPPLQTADPNATFEFTSTISGSTFECSLDGAGFSACASPASYEDLDQGRHMFAVRATSPQGGVDASPATLEWAIDAVAPVVEIVSPAPLLEELPAIVIGCTEVAAEVTVGPSGISIFTFEVNGRQVGPERVSFDAATGTYSFRFCPAPGIHSIQAAARNGSGLDGEDDLTVIGSR